MSWFHVTVFKEINHKMGLLKSKLKEKSKTSELRLLYINYINIVKKFIFAEKTSNWELHLIALSRMLDLFSAFSRTNYAKSDH